jgi:anti-sigma regulatory factor (Ser/Thr protein kinase)
MAVMNESTDGRSASAITSIRDVEQYHWQLAESELYRQSLSNQSHLSLAAAVELACIEQRFTRAEDLSTASVRLPCCPIWQLVRAARWPSRRRPVKLRDGSVVLIVLPSASGEVWWVQRLQEVQRELGENGFGSNLARALTSAVAEMVDNVWIHSAADWPGLLAYQIKRRKFAFSVADLGIGVLSSLRRNPQHRDLVSSMDALQKAVQPGVSSHSNGDGLGFPSLLHALAELWGTTRLRSGEAAMVIDRTSENRKKNYLYLPELPGLHVAVRCSLDSPR